MYVCYTMELFARKDFLNSKLIEEEKSRTEDINIQLQIEVKDRLSAEKELEKHKVRLEHLVRARTKELDKTQHEIVYILAAAAEYCDTETAQHIKRMSKTCVLLARELGICDTNCELLLHASQMHDIGKIGIPDSILLKPGKLDPAEWEIIKKHTNIGAEILSGNDSELLKMAKIVALTHHEKWDGLGYPKGLKGEDIPLIGRIVCICDVFRCLAI